MEGVTSELILGFMKNKNAKVVSKEQLIEFIQHDYINKIDKSKPGKILITAGAGDIDKMVQTINNILLNKN